MPCSAYKRYTEDSAARAEIHLKVHFLGVWYVFMLLLDRHQLAELVFSMARDTVAFNGPIMTGTASPRNVSKEVGHVCYFRQALALDEHRVAFLPQYAEHSGPTRTDESNTIDPHILEVWFAGTHFDMYVDFTPATPTFVALQLTA